MRLTTEREKEIRDWEGRLRKQYEVEITPAGELLEEIDALREALQYFTFLMRPELIGRTYWEVINELENRAKEALKNSTNPQTPSNSVQELLKHQPQEPNRNDNRDEQEVQ